MKKIISIILGVVTFLYCLQLSSFCQTTQSTLMDGACPTTGNVKVLTIVIQYKNLTPDDDRSIDEIYDMIYSDKYDKNIPTELVGTQQDSLRSFYYRQSYGKLKITGDIYEYETKEDYTYYLFSNYKNLTNKLILEAIEELNISPDDYDSNNDGYIDSTIIYVRNNKTNKDSTDYLCGAGCSFCMEMNQGNVGYLATISNLSYNNEKITNSNISLYHEFLHTFGFYDVYEESGVNSEGTNSSTIHQCGVGGISAAHKIELGWLNPVRLDYGTIMIGSTTTDENAYIIDIDGQNKFIVEYCSDINEKNTYFNNTVPKRGIRIWKVKYEDNSRSSWYLPWSYFICKTGNDEDTSSLLSIEDLVEDGQVIDLYYSTEYTYEYNSSNNVTSKTPANYIYSGYSISVNSTDDYSCSITVYDADVINITQKIIEFIKKIFNTFKLFKETV